MKNNLSTKERPFDHTLLKAEDCLDGRRADIETLEMLGLLDLLSKSTATCQGDACKLNVGGTRR